MRRAVREPDAIQRFVTGFAYAGLGALVLLGVVVGYKLLHVSGSHAAADLIVGWLIGSGGLALAGGCVNAVRPAWALFWAWWT